LRPFQVNKKKLDSKGAPVPVKSDYERQLELKQRLKSMLENEQLIPRVGLRRNLLKYNLTLHRN
jgi:aarF domain-containing kinase